MSRPTTCTGSPANMYDKQHILIYYLEQNSSYVLTRTRCKGNNSTSFLENVISESNSELFEVFVTHHCIISRQLQHYYKAITVLTILINLTYLYRSYQSIGSVAPNMSKLCLTQIIKSYFVAERISPIPVFLKSSVPGSS